MIGGGEAYPRSGASPGLICRGRKAQRGRTGWAPRPAGASAVRLTQPTEAPMPTRRRFLQAAVLGAAATAVSADAGEPNPEPAGVIDTHTHFYDPTRPEGVPWPAK